MTRKKINHFFGRKPLGYIGQSIRRSIFFLLPWGGRDGVVGGGVEGGEGGGGGSGL